MPEYPFCTIVSHDCPTAPAPGPRPPGVAGNWVRFAHLPPRPAPLRPRPARRSRELGLFRTIERSTEPGWPEIGFVLHISPSGATADRRNWVRFAHLALPPTPPWPRPTRHHPELGSFRTIGRPAQVCRQSAIRNPQSKNWVRFAQLGSFCTIAHHGDTEDTENEIEVLFVKESKTASVISVPLWRTSGNWVRFAHSTPADWVRFA
jgi:hypothetical protein